MSSSIKAITVYCSSSSKVDPVYPQAAAELGRSIAENGWQLVYGGNRIGTMGALADAARSAGGKVIGITPQLLVDKGIADNECDELIITSDMRQRKALMEQRGDAFIALPGGLGTFEEIFEIIVGRHLGFHSKPTILLNIAGYYQRLLDMVDHGIQERFIKASGREAFCVAHTVSEAITHLRKSSYPTPPQKPTAPPLPSAAE